LSRVGTNAPRDCSPSREDDSVMVTRVGRALTPMTVTEFRLPAASQLPSLKSA
jgi:hypothetical protein